jgi:hypothetical protein
MTLSQELREAGVWHEVGHVHFEHHFKMGYDSQLELREARKLAIEQGQVMAAEEEADRFAVARAGKEATLAFLNYILSTRPPGDMMSNNYLGRRELEIRIATIKTW